MIAYIEHAKIDVEKWNCCIANAPNTRIYANDWHLDRTAENWDALVFGDYEYVMPLPVRKKWWVGYVYQPLYSQQLGIFPSPSTAVAQQFFQVLQSKFRFVDVNLNSWNNANENIAGITFEARENFLLPLNTDYTSLSQNFSKNTKRNISKAKKHNLNVVEGIRLEEYLAFKKENLPPGTTKKDIGKLKSIIAFGQYKGFGEIHGVYGPNNKLCAAVYFCWWKNRVTFLNAASNEEGKNLGAMFLLVDKFIRTKSMRNLTLDFEGSMVPGVARFYQGFGATPETYLRLRINRLPLLLKWWKK